MKLTVFGATGATGTLLMLRALGAGHRVTAYVRSPQKIPFSHDNLVVREGQLDDADAVSAAINGADAVISTLGPRFRPGTGTPITDGMRTITEAMAEHGVKRLIAISTASAPEPRDRAMGMFRPLVGVVKRTFRRGYDEMVGQAKVVRATDLEWTLVRVPLLVNGPVRPVRAGLLGESDVGLSLTRASLAAFMVEHVDCPTWVGLAPAISN